MDQTAVDNLLGQAIQHHQGGNPAAAEQAYRQVLTIQPDNADALHLLGLARHHQNDHAEALVHIDRALGIAPRIALFHNSRGSALRGLGRLPDAINALRQAIELDPDHGEALANLGELLLVTGDIQQAGLYIRQALEADPSGPETWFNLANILFQEGDRDGSITALQKVIELEPRFAPAYERLGALLHDVDRLDEAIDALNSALRLNSSDASSWLSLGLCRDDLGQLEESHSALRRAIELQPDFVEAHQNLGTVLRAMGQYEAALAAYDKALALNPGSETTIANRALALLAEGRFEEGWQQYLTRPSIVKYGDRLHRTPLPEDLSGQPVLVLRDQGLGDEIYFLRFVRELAARNATITYRGQSQVVSMVSRLSFLETVLDEAQTAPPETTELWVSAADLPHILGMNTSQNIPPTIRLTPRPELVDKMKARLSEFGAPPYLGITWRAGLQKRNRLSKIAPADALAGALRNTTGTIIALQRNPEPGEIADMTQTAGRDIHDLTKLNDDLESMLALLACLDDYICVSNTNVHLREALGRTSRVLVPHPADYRWMNSGDESPWFPGTQVYRETYESGWETALDHLTAHLALAYGDR